MSRLPLAQFEQAARDLCQLRGYDPDKLTFYGDPSGHKRPKWISIAENLRNLYESEEALERNGL